LAEHFYGIDDLKELVRRGFLNKLQCSDFLIDHLLKKHRKLGLYFLALAVASSFQNYIQIDFFAYG